MVNMKISNIHYLRIGNTEGYVKTIFKNLNTRLSIYHTKIFINFPS